MNAGASFSQIALERYLLNEVSDDERSRIDVALATDADLRDRLDALRAESAALLDRLPPAALAARVRVRSGAREASVATTPRCVWLVPVAGATLAGVLAVTVWRLPQPSTVATAVGESGERIKGLAPELRVYRRDPAGAARLVDGAPAAPGDTLQLGIVPAGAEYGVVLSVDGNGIVTLHFPATPDASTALPAGGETLLPFAYTLDDAPRFERFYFVGGATPPDVRAVLDAARATTATGERATTLPLSESLSQFSLLLRKGVSR